MTQFEPSELAKYPTQSGVYIMKSHEGKVLYIGKAKNLKARLKQYFQKSSDDRAQIPYLMLQVSTIETIITTSEKEALLLENTLIKHHQPKYNILLKDDKTFISIMVTTKDPWPMAKLVRFKGKPKEKGEFFGPYTNALAARETFDLISRVFPLRECSDRELASRKRPCLLHSIKRCSAPCVGRCTKQEYDDTVKRLIQFLKGKDKQLILELKKEMQEASDLLEFERAARLHKMVQQMESIVNHRSVLVHAPTDECDVIGYFREGQHVLFVILMFRNKKLIASENFDFHDAVHNTSEVIPSFLIQHYRSIENLPREIFLPVAIENTEEIAEILTENKEQSLRLRSPQRGEKKELIDLAMQNAASLFERTQVDERTSSQKILLEMEERFSLDRLPVVIECFDTSNISLSDPVASMATFIDGKKNAARSRLYMVKSGAGDDYGAMYEVLMRRYQRAIDEDNLPDLLIVDGGKGQLGVACKVFDELGITNVDVISLVKEQHRHDKGLTKERVCTPNRQDPIEIDPHSSLMFFLQRVRDEAHRMAINYHKKRRSKRTIKSELEEIPNIGPKKRTRLLQHFGSVKSIEAASLEDLKSIQGISEKDAQTILDFFKKKP